MLGEPRLDVAEAADELLVRRPQRGLGIDLQVASDVGDDEQQVAELLLDLAARLFARGGAPARVGGERDLLELGELLLELFEHRRERGPVEADLGRFVLQLDGARQCRQRDGHVGQKALSPLSPPSGERVRVRGRNLHCGLRPPLTPTLSPCRTGRAGLYAPGNFLRLLFGLDALPETSHGAGVARFLVAEHVRVAADHLRRDRLDDVAEGERAGLLGHARVIDDLQQEIAELVLEVGEIAARDRVGDLVGLLDRVGRDRRERLLEVPRAAGAGRRAARP